MFIKICQTCKKPFGAAALPYIKFCSIECVDEAYTNRRLDQETTDYAIQLAQEDISAERERERES